MKGWVYIITNPSMPNVLKVGWSKNDPKLRAEQFNTGAPDNYVVEYDALVDAPDKVEKKAHVLLKNHNIKKEWFGCSIFIAVIAIREAVNYSIMHEFFREKEIEHQTEQYKNCKNIGKFIVKESIAINIETGLMCLRFGYGQTWENNTLIGNLKWINWENSFEIIKLANLQNGFAGYIDWRLPTIEELKYIISNAQIEAIFPNSISNLNDWYWSSTPVNLDDECAYSIYDEGAYGISFTNGNISWTEKYEYNYMRLVRNT